MNARILAGWSVFLIAYAGCGNDTNTYPSVTDTGCAADVAKVAVFDGFTKLLCGCDEASDTRVDPPAQLVCTVSVGTTVFFHFLGTRLRSQIVPEGAGSEMRASGMIDPADEEASHIHFFKPATVGDHGFTNVFFEGMSGRIVAR